MTKKLSTNLENGAKGVDEGQGNGKGLPSRIFPEREGNCERLWQNKERVVG
jgi:hypothetical protein